MVIILHDANDQASLDFKCIAVSTCLYSCRRQICLKGAFEGVLLLDMKASKDKEAARKTAISNLNIASCVDPLILL